MWYKLILLLLAVSFAGKLHAQKDYPFQDRRQPVEKRIDNILSLLTIDEKIGCLSTNPTVARLGLKGTGHTEGLHGLALGIPGGWGRKTPVATTIMPQSIGMAETWDTAMIRRAAAIEGYEARYYSQTIGKGGLVIRAPNADLGRDPRWGRTEECYGEDAFFNGTLVAAYVHGLQGDDPDYWQAASLMKHFLANSNENSRDSSSSDFDERLFREYYSVPFRMGIEAGSRAYMASYNKVNGIPQAVNPSLRKITVDQWGENGIICTDGGAYRMLVSAHHYFKTPEEAAAACIKAGINQFLDNYKAGVKGALDQHLLTEKDLDTVLRGVFRVMIRLGELDDSTHVPYASIRGGDQPWTKESSRQFVRLITQRSIVLLKNTEHTLPLDKNTLHSIAVVGSRSDQVLQDWYSGSSGYTVSPLEGIKNKLGPNTTISHTTNDDLAISLAKAADVAIVCVGNHPTGNMGWKKVSVPSEGKEAVDREQIDLDSTQQQLVEKVFRANPKTIVVLISSFPYSINWIQAHVPAIVHLSQNSQELGNALADVLFGDVDPGGRLVQTWPKSLDQLPPMMDYNIRNGRTYMYFKGEPLYPFGYGLTYTSFDYANAKINTPRINPKTPATISVDITNTGDRVGDEVVQLYITHIGSRVSRPIKELKGFSRITLQPHETKTVSFPLKAADLAYWNEAKQKFVVENDQIKWMIGGSSADVRASGTVSCGP